MTTLNPRPLCFIDVETTGLDPRIHQPYEVSWWLEGDEQPFTRWLEHDLTHADPVALEVGGYWRRGVYGTRRTGPMRTIDPPVLAAGIEGTTLVGANPAFDAAMLTRYIGVPVWHYRLIDVETYALAVFDWDRPRGLSAIVAELRDRKHDVPIPDHTAEGDVRATRAAYYALRAERAEALR